MLALRYELSDGNNLEDECQFRRVIKVVGTFPSMAQFKIRERNRLWCAMTKAAQYRHYAEECKQFAKTLNGDRKETLLKIAAAWENCAREADARGEALGE